MADITEEQIRAILNLEGLDTAAVIETISEINRVTNEWGESVQNLDSKTKLLFASMKDTSWVEGWSKALDHQIESEKVLGNISSAMEEQRFVRDEITKQLEQELNSLLKSQKQKQQAVEKQQELVTSLQGQQDKLDELAKADAKLLEMQEEMKEAHEGVSREKIKQLSLTVRQSKAQDDLSRKAENMIGTITGIGDQWKNTFVGAIVESGAAVDGFGNKVSAIGKAMAEGFSVALSPMNLMMSSLQKVIEMTIMVAFEMDKAQIGFRQAQGVGEEYDTTITELWNVNKEYSMSIAENTEALAAVRSGMTTLGARTGESAKELAAFIGPLTRLGIDSKTATENMDSLMNTLGQTQEEAKATTHRMISLAQALGKAPKEMIAEFNAAMPQLAVHGKNAERVFKELAITAAATGVEVSRLIGIAEGFDTFESAGKKVGHLNAILGGAFFNQMEMIQATDPEERIRLLQEGFQKTGKSFDELSYYQKKAIAEAGGFKNVLEAGRMLSMSAHDRAEAAEKAAAAAEKEKEENEKHEAQMRKNVEMQVQFGEAMKEFGAAAAPVLDVMRKLMVLLKPFMTIIGAGIGLVADFVAVFFEWGEGARTVADIWTSFTEKLKVIPGWAKIALGLGLVGGAIWFVANAMGAAAIAGTALSWPIIAITAALILLGIAVMASLFSPPLYIGMGLLAIGIFAVTKASKTAGPQLLYVGGAVLLMGAGVALAALGIAQLATAMQDMSGGAMVGLIAVLAVIMGGFTAMMLILAPISPVVLVIAGAFAIFGAGMLLAGAGTKLFGEAVATILDSFGRLLEIILSAVPEMVKLAAVMLPLALGLILAGPGAIIFAVGLGAMALGFGALALSLALIKTEDLQALGSIISGFGEALGQLSAGEITAVAAGMFALIGALTVLAVGMVLAAPGAVLLGAGLFVLALGFGALALSLAFIKTDDLVALGNIFQGLGSFAAEGAVNIKDIPGAIESISEQLEDLDLWKMNEVTESIDKLTASLERLAAAKVLGDIFGFETGFAAPAAAGPAATAGLSREAKLTPAARVTEAAEGREQARLITEATITTKESTVTIKEIFNSIMEKIGPTAAGARPVAAAPAAANLPKGVLVTRDVVIDLGREFDYKLKRKVLQIIEKEIKQK